MREWIAAVSVVTIAFAVTLGFLALAGPALQKLPEDVKLPLLIVVAVVALLGSIAFVVVAFAIYKLIDPQQALGLPDGSVRAIIALLLVVLFAALTVFLTAKLGVANAPPALIDFAKQVLTILGTLMTSIASFYFGAKSVSDAVRVVSSVPPSARTGSAPVPPPVVPQPPGKPKTTGGIGGDVFTEPQAEDSPGIAVTS